MYGRVLIGKELGQFHSDFDGADYATESIFLAKKVYYDKLAKYDGTQGDHIRMKGISGDAIKFYCKENNMTVLELYKFLFKGGEAKFDLTCN